MHEYFLLDDVPVPTDMITCRLHGKEVSLATRSRTINAESDLLTRILRGGCGGFTCCSRSSVQFMVSKNGFQ